MIAVVQRVQKANVSIRGKINGEISSGLVVLLGVSAEDTESDVNFLVKKIANLRIFDDDSGKMNLSLLDIGGSALVISQFTLLGSCKKGRRPSFSKAAAPDAAKELYDTFVEKFREENPNTKVETGIFQENMLVSIYNEGPVTLIVDSRE